MSNKGSVFTRKVIAQLLNLSEKRIKQLTEEGIIEEYSDGYYKLAPAVQGYVKYLQSQISDDDQTSDYNTEKAKLTKVKREDAELNLMVKKNELHKSEDVEFIVTNLLVAFKSKLEVLPYKGLAAIANIPDGNDRNTYIISSLKDIVDEALTELADFNLEYFDDEKYLASLDDTITDVEE